MPVNWSGDATRQRFVELGIIRQIYNSFFVLLADVWHNEASTHITFNWLHANNMQEAAVDVCAIASLPFSVFYLKNTHNLYSVTRSHFVAKLSNNDNREAPGQLTSCHELWGFLDYKYLLFNKVRIVGDNPVGIHGTSDFVEA